MTYLLSRLETLPGTKQKSRLRVLIALLLPVAVNVTEEPKHTHWPKKGNRNIHHMEINRTTGQFQTLKSFRNYSVVYTNGSFIFLCSEWVIKSWNTYKDTSDRLIQIIMKELKKEQDYCKTSISPFFTYHSPGALKLINIGKMGSTAFFIK